MLTTLNKRFRGKSTSILERAITVSGVKKSNILKKTKTKKNHKNSLIQNILEISTDRNANHLVNEL